MARSSTLLLALGATGLLATAGFLVKAVHSGTDPEVTSTAPTTTPSSSTTASRANASAPTVTRTPMWRPQPRAQTTTDSPATEAPVLANDDAPPASRENTKNLHFGGTQLRAQNVAVKPLVEKCVQEAAEKGVTPTGEATLTYIVVRQGEKVVVEDTGIDDSKTTLQAPALLDCMRETARKMTFEGLPREAEGLVVTRSVTLEAGKIVDYEHVGFSYLR